LKTLHPLKPRLLLLLAALLFGVHAVKDALGADAGQFGTVVSAWFEPVVFLVCGLATLARAPSTGRRGTWLLVGAGLTLYASGNVYYNLAFANVASPPFPSIADWLWLSLYPLTFAALASLVRRRFKNLTAAVWLDGVIGGGVVAATVAAAVFNSVFNMTVAGGAASIARLAYPVGDLVMVGVVIAVWSVAGRRLSPLWAALGVGFGLLAIGDSAYVVQAAHGTWAPGNDLDYPYALGTMLIAAAAWLPPPYARSSEAERTGVRLPVACGLAALSLTSVAVLVGLNPLATALSLITMLAVVMRLGSTLARVNRQSRELAALAAADPLTGLPNHRTVHERLARELKRAKGIAAPLSVIALDIDHFKSLNDTYGHTEGDAALQAIAALLSRQVSGRQLVGRVGGEEFALVLPDVKADEAFAIAERCRSALSAISVHGAGLSCSAGVASFPADDEDGSRLLEYADGALYWAKRSGRALTRRYDPREVILLSSAEQRAQVRAVIDSDSALTPVFQPIVELATGRVAGYEALTRFTGAEPARAPDLWFAQARRCGMGPALEAKALAVALSVPGRPPGTFLSLNVSPAALVSAEVAAALPEDLSDIVIELTEDEVFSSDISLDATLSRLRDRGARIAVDDAGAGYAGLKQVMWVRPDIVKLDLELTRAIHSDPVRMALVESLVRFARRVGATVCAEGIENHDDIEVLANLDVPCGQGYAIGRPAPPWSQVAPPAAATCRNALAQALVSSPGGDNPAISAGDRRLEHLSARLANARSRDDLNNALDLIAGELHADKVALSQWHSDMSVVETLAESGEQPEEEFFTVDEYPTTGRVLERQESAQVMVGDPHADPREIELMFSLGYRTLLMVPVVHRGESLGIVEAMCHEERPWTRTEMNRARIVANQLASVFQTFFRVPDPERFV